MDSKQNVLFSVIMPIYNKEGYIRQAVDSILKQTLQSFEIIIVCDPSTDNSNHEVESISDSRVRVFHRNKPGPGGYAARNLGIKKAQGEWLAFLDADDVWYPDHLKKMKSLSEVYPNEFFLGSGWLIKSSNSTAECPFFKLYKNKGPLSLNVEDYISFSIKKERPVLTSMCCVKRSSPIVEDLFPEDRGAKRGGDLYAWLKLVCYHKSLAWSNHLGGIYSASVEGQTIKSAESTPYLMNSYAYDELCCTLNNNQKKLLKKSLNRSLKDAWLGNIKRNKENFNIRKYCYFKGDLMYGFYLVIFSFLPVSRIYSIYKSLK